MYSCIDMTFACLGNKGPASICNGSPFFGKLNSKELSLVMDVNI